MKDRKVVGDKDDVKDRKVVGDNDESAGARGQGEHASMWEKLVEEAKTTKRQLADIEDSDEDARAQDVVVVGKTIKE